MPQYAFILGRKYSLSVAELVNFFGSSARILDSSTHVLIASFDKDFLNPQQVLDLLGGTVKIVEIFQKLIPKPESLSDVIAEHLLQRHEGKAGKLLYGVSVYSFAQKDEIILKNILKNVKKILSQKKVSSRFINHGFKNPENAAIKGERLLQKGSEIVVINGKNGVYVGETKALQDFESYSDRDFGRPARDPRLGMLPPKLAQIMINLAGINNASRLFVEEKNDSKMRHPLSVLWDPFCGVGTVLMEGLLMGYQVVGSDINTEVLQKALKNLEWICTSPLWKSKLAYGHDSPRDSFHLFQKDATKLFASDIPRKIDMVVTESYLGPPVSRLPLPESRQRIFNEIRFLTRSFFIGLQKFLPVSTPIVISFPFYRENHRFYFIENLIEEIESLGFVQVPLVSREILENFMVRLTDRGSLLYDRPDQVVGREIFKFSKKSGKI